MNYFSEGLHAPRGTEYKDDQPPCKKIRDQKFKKVNPISHCTSMHLKFFGCLSPFTNTLPLNPDVSFRPARISNRLHKELDIMLVTPMYTVYMSPCPQCTDTHVFTGFHRGILGEGEASRKGGTLGEAQHRKPSHLEGRGS